MVTIFYNGHILDMTHTQPLEALAMEGEIIVATGTFEKLKRQFSHYRLHDLKGHTLMPGFNDSHLHLLGFGQSLHQVQLNLATSLDAFIQTCLAFLDDHPLAEGQWLLGRGWNQDNFVSPVLPSRTDLDQISHLHPIFLRRACGHIGVANTKALELVGLLSPFVSSPEGGHIDLDEQGMPTGILRENAMDLLLSKIPTPSDEVLTQYILAAQNALFSGGITSVSSDDLCVFPLEDSTRVLRLFEALGSNGLLKISIHEQSLMRTKEHLAVQLDVGYAYQKQFGAFSHGPLKILADGSLGARTAFLNAPYEDDPATNGIAMYEKEALFDYVETAFKNGIPVAIHAIGDGMIDRALDAIAHGKEVLDKSCPRLFPKLRNAIVHCQITNREQLYRMRDLGVIGMVQPIFLDYDIHIVQSRVGEKRALTAYAFKTMEQLGIPTCYGTDCPVEDFNVFKGIQCAVTRKDLKGYPEQAYLPSEAVTVAEALHAYTLGGAYASREESLKGSLTAGAMADLVILNANPYLVAPEDLSKIQVLHTFKNGELVYTWKK